MALLLSLVLGVGCAPPSHAGSTLPSAKIEHGPIAEQSGLTQSARWPGVFWVHNDGGNDPTLFAIDASGQTLLPSYLKDRYTLGPTDDGDNDGDRPPWPGLVLEGASNIDWEDITVFGDMLVVAELGNNGNARRDLGLYLLPEPNPLAVSEARPLKFVPVAYPDQEEFPAKTWNFDCEAVFAHQGKLYALTKHRKDRQMGKPAGSATLYRLDSLRTDEVNVFTRVDGWDGFGSWVTGADMSPDGGTLAVLVSGKEEAVFLFETPSEGDALLSTPPRRIALKDIGQAEGIAWISSEQLLVSNEGRSLFTVPVD